MKKIGPALLVTAAFIGPGTLTTASIAGANFGFALLWALLFSIFATYILQEMAGRLALVSRQGLAQTIRNLSDKKWLNWFLVALVVGAIGIGNAAYQGGNITGAALGVTQLLGGTHILWTLIIGLIAAALLWLGKIRIIELFLIAMVITMSTVFLLTAIMSSPNFGDILSGFVPSMPDGSTLMVIALIGTTVVPYNLFLQSGRLANLDEQDNNQAINENRKATLASVSVGGLITLAILSSSAAAFFGSSENINAANMAVQLKPILGDYAGYMFAFGLFAAGLTSAITAPLAAAYAVCGALGWSNNESSKAFRGVWLLVLLSGLIFATSGIKPLLAILFAQATNGILLPIIAILLLWAMNQKAKLGEFVNSRLTNLVGGFIVVAVSLLSVYKLYGLII